MLMKIIIEVIKSLSAKYRSLFESIISKGYKNAI